MLDCKALLGLKARARVWGKVLLVTGFAGLLSVACERHEAVKDFPYQHIIPFEGSPMTLLADDIDGDGRKDLLLTSHGRNYGRAFYQNPPRQFSRTEDLPEEIMGFHPGLVRRWPTGDPLYFLNAEGANQLRSFSAKKEGGFALVSTLKEHAPVQSAVFHWPDWGEALAVCPYESDDIILFRDFDPRTMRFAQRYIIPLAKEKPSIREAGRILPLDADGDGIDELYFTVGIMEEVWKIVYPGANTAPRRAELVANVRGGVPDVILTADFNDDGAPDLLIPDKVPLGWLHILLNDGHGAFKEIPVPNLLPRQELQQFAVKRDKDGVNTILIVGVRNISLLRVPSHWTGGEGLEVQTIPRSHTEASQDALLEDIDGDGWLDVVAGLDRRHEGAWVVYGPVWEHFKDMVDRKFVLMNKPERD